jgi:hypothetical protein
MAERDDEYTEREANQSAATYICGSISINSRSLWNLGGLRKNDLLKNHIKSDMKKVEAMFYSSKDPAGLSKETRMTTCTGLSKYRVR